LLNRLEIGQGFVTVLMYHGLETDGNRLAANPLDITPTSCIQEITFYRDQGYRFIGVDELEDVAANGGRAAAYLVISFDDGHLNTFEPIRRWLVDEKIPVLLGVCPEIVEQDGMYWWEEARARFEGMRGAGVELTVAGRRKHFEATDVTDFEEVCRAAAHSDVLLTMNGLRQETGHLEQAQVRASRFVHQNMGWTHLQELVATGLCTLAAHGLAHEIATNLDPEELLANGRRCRQMIQARIGVEVCHYAYANGMCSNDTDRVLAECGYRHTYSTKGARNPLNGLAMRLNRYHGFGLQPPEMGNFTWVWNQRHPST